MFRWMLLGLVLVAPYLVIGWARRRALRGGATATGGWFAFVQTLQWTAIVYCGVWGSAYQMLWGPIASGLARHGLQAWAVPAILAVLGVPLVAFQVFAALSMQAVNRALRGTEVSSDEVLSDQMRPLVGVGVLLAALCGVIVAITLRAWLAAIGVALAGILSSVLSSFTPRARGAALAITHGELRDRLFAWAAQAGVSVRQLYILPLARTRVANAVAVQGQSVMVTDYLLAQLGRDEMDAVMAHELAHLKLRHPTWLAATMLCSLVVAWQAYTTFAASYAGPVALVVMVLVFMAVSRRIEYAADAGAVAMGIRAEALITGLARVCRANHVPQDWGRLREWTLTHPSNRRRAIAIARRAGIPLERIDALLSDTSSPADRYPVPPQVRGDRVFTTAFKSAVLARNGWLMLFANAIAGAAFTLAIGRTGLLDGLGPVRFAPIGVLAFAAVFLFHQHLGMRPYRELRARLLARRPRPLRGPDEHPPLWVGLSPGEEPRLYEGFLTWDVGWLELDSHGLIYRGEEVSFSLARDEIDALELGPCFPAWVPVRGVVMRWRRGEGEGSFTLLPIHATGLITYAREARALRDRLASWRAGTHPERAVTIRSSGAVDAATAPAISPAPVVPIEGPPAGPVTGTSPREALKPASLVITVVLQLTIAASVAILMAMPALPRQGPGVWDAVVASMMAYGLLITPLLGARFGPRRSRVSKEKEMRRAA